MVESGPGQRGRGAITLVVRLVLPEQWTFYLDIMANDQDVDVFPLKTAQQNSLLQSRTLRASEPPVHRAEDRERLHF